MNFTPLSQVIMALAITNCLRQCLLSLVLCMSCGGGCLLSLVLFLSLPPPPPRLLLPNLSGFLQVGLKRLPRTQTSLFWWKCAPAVCTLPMVPCGSSLVTRFSRSPLPCEKRSAWGGGCLKGQIGWLRPWQLQDPPFYSLDFHWNIWFQARKVTRTFEEWTLSPVSNKSKRNKYPRDIVAFLLLAE